MEDYNKKKTPQGMNNTPGKKPKPTFFWIYGLILAIIIGMQFINFGGGESKEISFLQFQNQFLLQEKVDKVVIVNNQLAEVFLKKEAKPAQDKGPMGILGKENKYDFAFNIGKYEVFNDNYQEVMKQLKAEGKPEVPVFLEDRSNPFSFLTQLILPAVVLVGLWVLVFRKMGNGAGGGAGGGIFNIGKSKAQLFEKGTMVNITFNDVAGLDEAKVEVMEIVDFLKNPKKYTALGGKIPKGALLVGPPGTGKTLLAKAVAGEAQVPFFSMSGSDFVEMFVGVGASRVRDLFKQAREKAPCIVFIDEIDAIGRARGKNAVMSNDERENTLNQMLVEMDGFSGDSGIIILAATNRPDVLDAALLRPGRFDRQISIDLPDAKGREKIFDVHLTPIKKSKNLDVKKLALQTPGFAGADIANVCNEAALIAARNGKTEVDMQDFNDAIDRIIGGLEKKNKIILPDEKKVIAYHEAGHAVAGWFLEHAHPLVKVTIVPRGTAALGFAQYLPREKYLTLTQELEDDMCMTLGGRASEEIFFGKISTGALSDLQQVTRTAYAMVSIYGMNDKIGNISFYDPQSEGSFQKPYSEETGKIIDQEVKILSDKAYQRAKALLESKRAEVQLIAEELLKKEVLFKDDLERLIGKRPYEDAQEANVFPVEPTPPVDEPIIPNVG
ncbi:AAA family ATPase [Taibaiella sp. KBW10]|uniref:ATP-dependent zinc metalloprotease FtsH n=1 Tax=Taibaiella sp. KBW10 TaxID=2153357 RepID=UPI000F5A6487|nr:ATP-dependent zinc metalloprotease FtsH [Taibaiella sp. KBW10]RQO32062.1 AAA family ATPase [Taibaiella sp. KBW10]